MLHHIRRVISIEVSIHHYESDVRAVYLKFTFAQPNEQDHDHHLGSTHQSQQTLKKPW